MLVCWRSIFTGLHRKCYCPLTTKTSLQGRVFCIFRHSDPSSRALVIDLPAGHACACLNSQRELTEDYPIQRSIVSTPKESLQKTSQYNGALSHLPKRAYRGPVNLEKHCLNSQRERTEDQPIQRSIAWVK